MSKQTGNALKEPAKLPRGNAILAKKAPKFNVRTEHFLKVVKKNQQKTPGKSITVLFPAAVVAQGGASYSPESKEYHDSVMKIGGEKQKLIHLEQKIKRGIEPQWETVTTRHKCLLEMAEGIRIHLKFGKDNEYQTIEGTAT